MPTVITTSTAATATAYSNQRKIDRCQNGVLWAMFWDGTYNTATSMQFRYSTDNGTTWTNPGAGSAFGFSGTGNFYINSASLFIDLDDYAHVVYRDPNDAITRYRRGTPNAERTAWTWSAATAVHGDGNHASPSLIVHREGTGWVAHVLASYFVSSTNQAIVHVPVSVTSGGGITPGARTVVGSNYSATQDLFYPSIDFNHTGDGKTVAGSTPHLYASWSAGATGAGKGIRFKKATYSGGTWTWGTEREIDSTSFANAGRISSIFDGTRVVIAYADSASTSDIKVRERDAADTATTTRTPTALSDGVVSGISVTYDSSGNIHLAALGATSLDPKVVKYDRAAGTWGSWATQAASARADTVSTKRGYAGGKIEYVYTDGAASPYSVTYDGLSLNTAPNAPILLTPIGSVKIDRALVQRFDWDFSDPDAGDSQSKYDLRYRIVGAGTWTTVTVTTPNTYHDFAAGTFAAGDYEWQVATYDAAGVTGPFSASAFYTAADAPPAPSITSPVNGATVSNSHVVQWSAPNQASYQLRRVADNAGAADTATVYEDTSEVVSTSARSRSVTFPVNNRWEHVQVRIKFNGLWSSWASVRVNVSYTPPAAPVVSLTAEAATGSLLVNITNPAPGAGQPPVTHNEVEVDDGNGWERRAASVTPSTAWRYWTPKSGLSYVGRIRVRAVGDNGTTSVTTA